MDGKILPTEKQLQDIKFMIKHEEDIDWESLSAFKGKVFSVLEIRLFGKSIIWHTYMARHKMNIDEIFAAANFFTDTTYFKSVLIFQNVNESFVEKYADKLDWLTVLNRVDMSEDFLFKMGTFWKHFSTNDIIHRISNNKYINLDSDNFKKLKLFLKLNI